MVIKTSMLLCKINAILNRKGLENHSEKERYEIGTFRFYPKKRTIIHGDEHQNLSPKEAELLKLLCQKQEELLPRETALRKIWGEDGYFTARSMDVFITKLRKYMAGDPNIEIKNIHGSGFILEVKNR